MPYNPNIHHRRSIRLKGYDYSQAGAYFITICCENRECRYGKIENDMMILNDAGKMIETQWLALTKRFTNIKLHEFIVMPNHFHGILEIAPTTAAVGASLVDAQNNITLNNITQNNIAPNNIAQNDISKNNITQNNITPNNIAPNNIASNHITQNDIETNKNAIGQPNEIGQPQGIAPTDKTVGDIMDAFKSITTVEYIGGVKNLGWQPFNGKLWQRNYYEHIIRNEQSYQTISNYIIQNPAKWKEDKFYTT